MLSVVADYRCRVFDFELHLNLFLSKSLNPIYMKLKIVISILLLALSLNFTYAQKFFHGEITLINNRNLEGFVNPPNRPGDKTIKFGFAYKEEYKVQDKKELDFNEPELSIEDFKLVQTINSDPTLKKNKGKGCLVTFTIMILAVLGLTLLIL